MPPSSIAARSWREHPSFGRVPRVDLTNEGRPCTRLVVVSAHPDDESLGAGGLIATASDARLAVYVVLLTAGESSPHASPTSTRHTVARSRLAELENALARLAPDNYLVFLGAPDGGVTACEEQVGRSLAELVGDGSRTLLAAPWRHDHHDDHAAAGRAAAYAARCSGARLLEFPLLAWATTPPQEAPWADMVCVDLDEDLQARKAAAIGAHVSQVRAAAAVRDGSAPLPGRVLEHFAGPHEHYVEVPVEEPAT